MHGRISHSSFRQSPVPEDIVYLYNLKKFYPRFTLSISELCVRQGETLVIMGESGAGKTTLLHIMGGFILPDEGEARVFGTEPHVQFGPSRSIRTLFQDLALFPHLSVRSQWKLALDSSSSDENPETIITDWARLLGLSDKLESLPGHLSGGQRQRVALGRALISKPKLVLLDEPMTSLGRRLRMDIWSALDEIELGNDTTLVVVTHDPEVALLRGDRIIVLENGCDVEKGSPQELYLKPQRLSVARILGDMNVVSYNGKTYMIRPELLDINQELKTDHIKLGSGVITKSRKTGNKVVVWVKLGEHELSLHVGEAGFQASSGSMVSLTCPQSALLPLKDPEENNVQ